MEFRGSAALATLQKLWFAAAGEEQRLAFVNQIGIVDGGIGMRNTCPKGSVAKEGPGDLREGVAFLNDDARGRPESRGYRGQKKARACHDVVGVNDSRIRSEQIMPAKSLAEILLCEFPEGIAWLHRDYVQFRRADGCGPCGSGRLRWRNSNDRRRGLGRSHAKNRPLGRCRMNHRRYGSGRSQANRGRRRRHYAEVRRRRGRNRRGH
jgi:hypothetical protein